MIRETFEHAADAIVSAFGQAVLYEGVEIQAVFGNDFRVVDSGEVRVSSKRPDLYVRFADLPEGVDEPEAGHTIEIPTSIEDETGPLFEVATVKPDLEGVGATLVLKRV